MRKKERSAFLEDLIAATSPEYLESIRETRADYKAGRIVSHDKVFRFCSASVSLYARGHDMTTLDREKTFAKFRDITESIERLKAFQAIPREDFLKDRDKQDIAGFRLIVAMEAAIDICLHTTSKLIKKVPEYYAACFELLAEHNLIDKELSDRLAQMARLRNLLVNKYWEIDYARLYEMITGSDLDDPRKFMRQIAMLIEERR